MRSSKLDSGIVERSRPRIGRWLALTSILLAGCLHSEQRRSTTGALNPLDDSEVESVSLMVASSTLHVGDSRPIVVVGMLADGGSLDLSDLAIVETSDANSIAVDEAARRIRGVAPGSARISARYQEHVSPEIEIVVAPAPVVLASLVLNIDLAPILVGETKILTVDGVYTDDSVVDMTASVSWVMNDASLANITTGSTPATLTALESGSLQFVATLNGLVSNAGIVDIDVLAGADPLPEDPPPPPPAEPPPATGTVTAVITQSVGGSGRVPCPVWLDAYSSTVSAGSLLHTAKCTWSIFQPSGALLLQRTGASLTHLFEETGLYSVQLVVEDEVGGVGIATSSFLVTPFTGTTITCGSDGQHQTFSAAMNALRSAVQGAGVVQHRLLFKAGQTFQTTGGGGLGDIALGSLVHIGRYGSGANPIIQVTSNNSSAFSLGYAANGVRLVDLDIRGPHTDGQGDQGFVSSVGIEVAQNGGSDFSCIRTSVRNFYNINVYLGHMVDGQFNNDRSFFNCTLERSGRYPLFASGERLSLVGCFIGRGWGPADWYGISRHSRIRKGYWYGNTWDPAGGVSTAVYLCSFDYDSQGFTEKVWISNNVFRSYLVLGRSGGHLPGLPREVVIQRNVFDRHFPTNHQASIMISGSEVTVRNNVILFPSTLSSCCATSVSKDTCSDPVPSRNPTNIWMYNNSVYRAAYSGGGVAYGRFLMVSGGLALEVNHVTTNNNIWRDMSVTEEGDGGFLYCYAPWAASTFLHSNHNLVRNGSGLPVNHWATVGSSLMTLAQFRAQVGEEANSVVVDPVFVGADSGDLSIASSSPASLTGMAMPGLYEDFLGHPRPLQPSIGAFEPQ
ncbi:MAG: hypothetical protein ACKVX7_08090 [Planctomycetota bacterium]